MSAAQRVLCMDELLRNVLSHVPTRGGKMCWTPHGVHQEDPPPSGILTAAGVSRQWRDVALDFLWADIDTGDLLSCILSRRYTSSEVRIYDHKLLQHIHRHGAH